ncbi:FkbM family methyltransferase [Halomicrobium urmianum]|uniref:FkbM family methyltransferase n=1 Tax=Halomicrobium urmianum TaxID=1586233 RepID=UPI001CD9DFEF|nr:FkbM family methyltransferase [Halomicrobium urmianum]
MESIPTISHLLQQARNQLYRGWVQRAVRWLGLNEYLSDSYWWLVFFLADDAQTHSIAEETVTFRTETFPEFMRFRDLAGEETVLEDLLNKLEPMDVFYDIGANVGTYMCFVSSKLKTGNVVGFEPEPENAVRLRENLAQNELEAQVFEVALSDTDGTIELALTGENAGEGEHAIATEEHQETREVQTAKGDTFVQSHEIPVPSVVKIDVEGAELSVLEGMQQTLQNHCRLVYLEIHPDKIEDYGGTPADACTLLEDIGFEIEKLEQRGRQYFILAENNIDRQHPI